VTLVEVLTAKVHIYSCDSSTFAAADKTLQTTQCIVW